jgi:hypothetical protein
VEESIHRTSPESMAPMNWQLEWMLTTERICMLSKVAPNLGFLKYRDRSSFVCSLDQYTRCLQRVLHTGQSNSIPWTSLELLSHWGFKSTSGLDFEKISEFSSKPI